MDYFESDKEAVLRTSILEQWNIQTRANLHVELVVDGGGEINSGCTVDVYVSEIEDTRWDIPAAGRSIPDSHLSFEEIIDKLSVPDSTDLAEKAAQTTARNAEEAEEMTSKQRRWTEQDGKEESEESGSAPVWILWQ